MNLNVNYGAWNPEQFINPYNEQLIPNITPQFFTFLENTVKLRDGTYDIRIIGRKRSGKTLKSLAIYYTLLLHDPKRVLIIYRNDTITTILEECDFFKHRVHTITNIIEVDIFIEQGLKPVIYFDEGVLDANAKEALSKGKKELGKAFATSSHKDTILIMNSQDDGVIKDIRGKSGITIYCRITRNYSINALDVFVRKNTSILTKLDEKQSIVISEHKSFDKIGLLEFNVFDIVPFLTPELDERLSKNEKNNSFSQYYNDLEIKYPKAEEKAIGFIKYF